MFVQIFRLYLIYDPMTFQVLYLIFVPLLADSGEFTRHMTPLPSLLGIPNIVGLGFLEQCRDVFFYRSTDSKLDPHLLEIRHSDDLIA